MPKDIDTQVKVLYDEKLLGRVDKYTYLVLAIDDKTSFESHINKLISKSYNKIYMLGKLRKYIDPRISIQINKSYILPQLEYCDYLLIGATTFGKFQKAVNHELRICFKAPIGTSIFKLHTTAQILPLRHRREIALLKKCIVMHIHDPRYIETTHNRRGRRANPKCLPKG